MTIILDASQLMPLANSANKNLPKINGNWTRQIQHFSNKFDKNQKQSAPLISELLGKLAALKTPLEMSINLVIKNYGNVREDLIPKVKQDANVLYKNWGEFKQLAEYMKSVLLKEETKHLKRLASIVARDINDILTSFDEFIVKYCGSLNQSTQPQTSQTSQTSQEGEWYIDESNFSTAQSENKLSKLAEDFSNKLSKVIK